MILLWVTNFTATGSALKRKSSVQLQTAINPENIKVVNVSIQQSPKRLVWKHTSAYLTDAIFKIKSNKMASYVHLENKTTFFIIYSNLLSLKLQMCHCFDPSYINQNSNCYQFIWEKK